MLLELQERLEELAGQMVLVNDAINDDTDGSQVNLEVDILKEQLQQTQELLEYWEY